MPDSSIRTPAASKLVDTVKVMRVNGARVRDSEIEFTMGGHHYRYPDLIPENEIWIDDSLAEKDILATLVHEFVERTVMKMLGMEYETAHEQFADPVERVVRNLLPNPPGLLKSAASRWRVELSKTNPSLLKAIDKARAQRFEIMSDAASGGIGPHDLAKAERSWEDALFNYLDTKKRSGSTDLEFGRKHPSLRIPQGPIPPALLPEERNVIWDVFRKDVPEPTMVEKELFETLGAGGRSFHRSPGLPKDKAFSVPKPGAAGPVPKKLEESLLKQLKWPLGVAGAVAALGGLGIGAAHLLGGRKFEGAQKQEARA